MKTQRKEDKMTLNMKIRRGRQMVAIAAVFSLIVFAFILLALRHMREDIESQYAKSTRVWLDHIVENGHRKAQETGVSMADGMVAAINSEFDTSARRWCVLAVGEEIYFVRDAIVTNEWKGVKTNKLFSKLSLEDISGEGFATGTLLDAEYMVQQLEENADGEVISLFVCTETDYLLKLYRYDVLRQQTLMLTFLLSLAFLFTASVMSYWHTELAEANDKKQHLVEEQRITVEKLQARLASRMKGTHLDGEGGMYERAIVDQVLLTLTEEQRNRSRQIIIHVEESAQEVLVQLSVLLERMLTGRSIGCLWERNELLVIIMDADEEAALHFARQLVAKYRSIYQCDIHAAKMTIERL